MNDPQRILVVKLADLGDLLTATPALDALRTRFPRAEITALVTPHVASLLDHSDACNRVITFPKALFDHPGSIYRPDRAVRAGVHLGRLAARLRGDRFDAVVLLHHLTTRFGTAKYRALLAATGAPIRAGLDNGKGHFLTHRAVDQGFGARHEVDYWLDVVRELGGEASAPRPAIHLTAGELAEADRTWTSHGLGDRVAMLHPGSGAFSLARRWPPDRFAAVGDALASDGLQIAIVVGPGEATVAEAVCSRMRAPAVLIDGLSSRQLAAVLRRAALFVGNDSGVMHVAAAMSVPIVAVFGLTNHRAWGPYPPDAHRVVRLELPCSPCAYVDHRLGTPAGCAARTCLVELGPEPVVRAARELLAPRHGSVVATPAVSS